MRLPELECWSIPPLDNPTRELGEKRKKENGTKKMLRKKICLVGVKVQEEKRCLTLKQ